MHWAAPALLCTSGEAAFQGVVAKALEAARVLLARAELAPAGRQTRLVRHVGRALARLGRQAKRAEGRARISSACRAAVEARGAALRAALPGGGEPPPVGLPGLPADVAGYTRWLRLNAAPIPPRPTGDAHFGTKDVYVSRARAASSASPTPRAASSPRRSTGRARSSSRSSRSCASALGATRRTAIGASSSMPAAAPASRSARSRATDWAFTVLE